MYQLIYTSIETSSMTHDGLMDMLEQAQEKNARLGVTGLLFYYKKEFVQILEGERETVLSLYQTIGMDPRHQGVMTFWEGEVEKRGFANWSMGFASDKEAELLAHNGYANVIKEGISAVNLTEHPNEGRDLIFELRDIMLSE